MQDTALGGNNEFGGVRLARIVKQGGCGANLVGHGHHGLLTFGMHEHPGGRMLPFQFKNLFKRKFLVHVAGTVPQHHAAAGYRVDVVAQVAVGAEDDFLVGGKRIDDFTCVARCDKNVGERLHAYRCVDIRYHRMARMPLYEAGELIGGTAVGQRASGFGVGHEHLLVGAEQFGGLAHEVHAAQHNYLCIGECSGILGQSQRIAYMVGYVLDGAALIIMSQNHSTLFLLETLYFINQGLVGSGGFIYTHFYIFLYFELKNYNR